MTNQNLPASEREPRHLTAEQIANPALVFAEFFDIYHLEQARADIWELLRALTTASWLTLEERERGHLFYLVELLQKLVEVSHVLHVREAA